MEDSDNEKVNEVLVGGSNIEQEDYKFEVMKSVCQIIIPEGVGTGFFLKCLKKGKQFKCLMTCGHVIEQKLIESKEEIRIKYDNKDLDFNIVLNSSERFIRNYQYLNIDISVIEIIDKDNLDDKYYLNPDLDYLNGYEQFEENEIFIVQFPRGKALSSSKGKIKKITHPFLYEFSHSSSTDRGSSGSPIILKGSNLVLGIHKQGRKNKTENYGHFIGPILTSLKYDFPYKKGTKIIKGQTFLYEYEERGDIFLGKFGFSGKEFYYGETKRGNFKEGKGVLCDENNKIIYEGEFKNDKYEGKGKIYYINGDLSFKGDFKNGEPIYGERFLGNGQYYKGEFKNYEFDGYGEFINQGGKYYGNVKKGKANGEGILYDLDDKKIYSGNFKDGLFDGYGELYYDDGDYYIGEFKEGKKHGKGKMYDKSGFLIYEGDYYENSMEGKGIKFYEEQIYEGEFLGGEISGKGKLLNKDGGIIYEGILKVIK